MAFTVETAEVKIEVDYGDLSAKLAAAEAEIGAFGKAASRSLSGSGGSGGPIKDAERFGNEIEKSGRKARTASLDFERLGKGIGGVFGIGSGIPLIGGAFGGLEKLFGMFGKIGGAIDSLGSSMTGLATPVGTLVSGFGGLVTVLGPVAVAIGALSVGAGVAVAALVALADTAGVLAAAIGGVGIAAALALAPVAVFGAGLAIAFKHLDANRLQHIKNDFGQISDAVARRFAPAINAAMTDLGKLSDWLTKEIKNKSFAQMISDMFSQGLPALGGVINQVTAAIANPFRAAINSIFGTGGGGDLLMTHLTNWFDRARRYFLGYNWTKQLHDGIVQHMHDPGVLDPITQWLGGFHFTKTGIRWAHELINGIGSSNEWKHLKQNLGTILDDAVGQGEAAGKKVAGYFWNAFKSWSLAHIGDIMAAIMGAAVLKRIWNKFTLPGGPRGGGPGGSIGGGGCVPICDGGPGGGLGGAARSLGTAAAQLIAAAAAIAAVSRLSISSPSRTQADPRAVPGTRDFPMANPLHTYPPFLTNRYDTRGIFAPHGTTTSGGSSLWGSIKSGYMSVNDFVAKILGIPSNDEGPGIGPFRVVNPFDRIHGIPDPFAVEPAYADTLPPRLRTDRRTLPGGMDTPMANPIKLPKGGLKLRPTIDMSNVTSGIRHIQASFKNIHLKIDTGSINHQFEVIGHVSGQMINNLRNNIHRSLGASAWSGIQGPANHAFQVIGHVSGQMINNLRNNIHNSLGASAWGSIQSAAASAFNHMASVAVAAVGRIQAAIDGLHNKTVTVTIQTNKVGHNALGTDYWPGGMTWVGERGPEIVNLPRGAQVIPTDRARSMGGPTVYLSIPTVFPADSRVKRELHRFINELMDTHSRQRLVNQTYELGI